MILPNPRICIWVCLSLLTILSRGDGLSAQAETPHGPSSVKVTQHPNMDAPGHDAIWVRGITSVEQCESLCLANGACAGYTYNIKQSACFQKSAIGPLAPSSVPTITGVMDRQSGGLAAQNRAITIVGKPSFDCRKAKSETAQAICGSTHLIQLDLQLAKLFWAKMAKLRGSSAEEEKRRQLDWGVGRNQCSADTACVEQSYQRRIAELGGKTPPPTIAESKGSTLPLQSQQSLKKLQQGVEENPQTETAQETQEEGRAGPKGPIATVQALPNPIRLIGKADQPCNEASAILAQLRKSLSVSVPDTVVVPAEGLRTIEWRISGEWAVGPAYLVFAADAPVHFRGRGFYALTPEAAAPFRFKQFVNQTRVIIPLHVKGAPRSGELAIRPLVVGPLHISAGVIGYTQCGENSDPLPIKLEFTVEPGAPEIIITDRFDLTKPDKTIASPDGNRRLEIYGPRYRLIDATTGALLADEIGNEVRFSPTGRFVIAVVENSFAIRDSINGKPAQKQSLFWRSEHSLVWDDRDSFAIACTDNVADGESYIWTPLEEAGARDITVGCGSSDFNLKLDLENNIAISNNRASSLTIETAEEPEGSSKDTDSLFAASVIPVAKPNSWDMIDGLKISHLESWILQPQSSPEAREVATKLAPYVVRPIVVTKGDTESPRTNNDPLRVASRGLGDIKLPEVELAMHREQRIQNFGIEINRGVPLVKLDQSAAFKKIEDSPGKFQFSEDKNMLFVDKKSWEGPAIKSLASSGTELGINETSLTAEQIRADGFRLTLFYSPSQITSEGDPFLEPYLHDSRLPGQLLDLSRLIDAEYALLGAYCDKDFFGSELFFDRYLVIWPKTNCNARADHDPALAVYDVKERNLINYFDDLPSSDVMQRISLSKDLKTLVKLDKDGGFQVIALRRGERDSEGHLMKAFKKADVLLSGRIVDDEVVIWTPSGQFDSTLEGASHLALRFPGRAGEYSLDQFHKLFHENDLLNRALAGEEFKPPVVKTFPPSINVKPAFTADSIAAKIDVVSDDPVEEFRIYQDGLMTNVMPVAGNAKAVEMSAKRLPSARWVAFLARGPSGLFAQPVTFDAGAFPGARRRVHIVSVGIDHYDDDTIQQLRFAGSDAARFLKALQDKAGTSVEIVSQTLLRDAEASRETILAKLNETIAKAAPGDSIILFIAGHGIQTADKNYYLATSATRKDDIPNTSLRWSDLSGALAKAHSRIAVFLDTCQSGAAGTDFFAPNDASVSALLDRAPSGILIFSASKGRELSEEAADHGGGLFTSAVLDALSKKETDRNHNGAIEASELYASVKRAVVEATKGRQTPWFARNDMVGDFVPF